MKSATRSLVLFAMLLLASGCGTMTGVVSGPLMGGTSLTDRLYTSDSSIGTKIVGTPFAFVGGTVVGVFPAVATGFEKDQDEDHAAKDFLEILDPFDAGLFRK